MSSLQRPVRTVRTTAAKNCRPPPTQKDDEESSCTAASKKKPSSGATAVKSQGSLYHAKAFSADAAPTTLTEKDYQYYQTLLDKLRPFFQQHNTTLEKFMTNANLKLIHAQTQGRFQDLVVQSDMVQSCCSSYTQNTNDECRAYRAIDIISGRGNKMNAHPGNWLFRQIVLMNKEFYAARISREDKWNVAAVLMRCFTDVGARFLELNEHGDVIHMEVGRVTEKFMQGLREKKWKIKCYVLDAIVERQKQGPMTTTKTAKKKLKTQKEKETKRTDRASPGSFEKDAGIVTDVSIDTDTAGADKELVTVLEASLTKKNMTLSRFLQEVSFQSTRQMTALVRGYQDYIKDRGDHLEMVYRARPTDILFGLGAAISKHPGNYLFRRITGMNQQFYSTLDRGGRHQVAMALVGHFVEAAGTRFLEKMSSGRYQEVTQERVLEKFMQALRERRPRGNKSSTTPAAKRKKPKDSNKRARDFGSESGSESETVRKKRAVPPEQKATIEKEKSSEVRTSRDKQRIQMLLSVGHYVLQSPSSSEDEGQDGQQPQEEEQSRILQEIRWAFRDSVSRRDTTPPDAAAAAVKSAVTEVTPEPTSRPEDDGADSNLLFQLYGPSRRGKFITSDVKTPLPVFFSDSP